MALILNLDTSAESASVSIAENGSILLHQENNVQKDHAAFLHLAIKEIAEKINIQLKDLDGIAVTEGPGSYTGLRVAMATAKGLCYTLNKPFITINTLEAMAFSAIQQINDPGYLYCPMIDARRMEVFTALYDKNMKILLPPSAIVLSESFLEKELNEYKIVFTGSGINKWEALKPDIRSIFIPEIKIFQSIAHMSYQKFIDENFTELAHSQPLYIKEFYNGN